MLRLHLPGGPDVGLVDINVVEGTLKSNYYGTLEASQALLPLIKDGGRLVNVSSMVSYPLGTTAASQFYFLDSWWRLSNDMTGWKAGQVLRGATRGLP